MPIKPDDVKAGKCYSTTIQGKPAVVKVLEVLGGEIEFKENAGVPGEKSNVQKYRSVKWVHRLVIPPKSPWTKTPKVSPMRDFVAAIKEEVSCG